MGNRRNQNSRNFYANRLNVNTESLIVPEHTASNITQQEDATMQQEEPKEHTQPEQRSPRDMMDSIINLLYAKIDKQMYQQLAQLERSLFLPQPKAEGEPKPPEESSK